MFDIDAAFRRIEEKQNQVDNQKALSDNCNCAEKDKIDTRRAIIVGKLFIKYFPIAQKFKPQSSTQSNDVEFEALEQFIITLASAQRNYQDIENKFTY